MSVCECANIVVLPLSTYNKTKVDHLCNAIFYILFCLFVCKRCLSNDVKSLPCSHYLSHFSVRLLWGLSFWAHQFAGPSCKVKYRDVLHNTQIVIKLFLSMHRARLRNTISTHFIQSNTPTTNHLMCPHGLLFRNAIQNHVTK